MNEWNQNSDHKHPVSKSAARAVSQEHSSRDRLSNSCRCLVAAGRGDKVQPLPDQLPTSASASSVMGTPGGSPRPRPCRRPYPDPVAAARVREVPLGELTQYAE
jgi:hypothetical protein